MINHPKLLRIALLTYSTKPRGSVIHTLELAEALQALGHQVCIFALDKDGLGFERQLGCEVFTVPAKAAPQAIDQLIKQRIQEFVDYLQTLDLDYDIYHAQDCISANALAMLRSQGLIPHFVRTIHHIEDYNSPYLQTCQDRSIREAALCLCVSDSWQRQIQEIYQIDALRVLNGVNLQRFSCDRDGSELQIQQKFRLTGSPLYLTVGGIEPRKNSLNIIQAFSQVLRDLPEAQLVIAGGATLFDYQDYRDRFMALVSELDIANSLVITGVLTDAELAALYRCANAFVFPSQKEGWGLVIMEAIASGIPVIISNCLPFTEFLNDQQALLVDPNAPAAIADAMRLILQPELKQNLVKASQTVLAKYSWKNSAEIHTTHYQSLIRHRM